MKHFLLTMTITLGTLLAATNGFAQATMVAVPYSMSFEQSGNDSVELAQGLWHFNSGAQAAACTDQWKIGTTVRSDGRRSLYAVEDTLHDASHFTTLTPGYGVDANLQFTYRDFVFPGGTTSTYSLSFDWLNPASADAAMYVGWVAFQGTTPSATNTLINSIVANSASGVFPASLTNNCSGPLYGAETWQNYAFTTKMYGSDQTSTTTYRVFIAWANKGNIAKRGYGAAIDNIQVFDSRCKAPTNVVVSQTSTCDEIRVTWNGTAQDYQVQFRKVGSSSWSTASYNHQLTPRVCVIDQLPEGSYEVRVRGKYVFTNGESYSAYTSAAGEAIVYCEDNHCIPFLRLDDPRVKCYIDKPEGTSGDFDGFPAYKNVAFQVQQKVDFGSTDKRSRHTVNWDRTATDPRTKNQLPVVPKGALASVRLGNWEWSAHAEGISYELVPDSNSILLLRYAFVLENPAHSESDMPRFLMEIYDQTTGQLIDASCGTRNFTSIEATKGTDPTWHSVDNGQVYWKEWTTVGLDLTDYAGMPLEVRLASYDCAQGGHYGYCYFTLDCDKATLESYSCGENNILDASAPDGFNYMWYYLTPQLDTVKFGFEQEAYIETTDSNMYYCRLTSTERADCQFELSIESKPRFPMADGFWTYDPVECQNRVVFEDKSYYQTRYFGQIVNHYGTRMALYEWDFGDGTTSAQANCTHIFPQEGGHFDVRLRVWLNAADLDCYADTIIPVDLPHLGDQFPEHEQRTICKGESYTWKDGKFYDATGRYPYSHLDIYGCMVYDTLDLFVAPTFFAEHDTTLCFGDALYSNGELFVPDAQGEAIRHFATADYSCDSTVVFHVTIKPEMTSDIVITQMEDIEDSAYVVINATNYDYYTINGDPTHHTRTAFYINDPGSYTFRFYATNDNGADCMIENKQEVITPCRFKLFQRWNDVLSLYNAEADSVFGVDPNAGATYQWYCNDVLIPGAVNSYYYAHAGLIHGASYTCYVRLANGTEGMSCPIIAENLPAPAKITVSPTILHGSDALHVSVPADAVCDIHNAMGLKLTEAPLLSGENDLQLALPTGVYVVTVRTADTEQPFRIMVK